LLVGHFQLLLRLILLPVKSQLIRFYSLFAFLPIVFHVLLSFWISLTNRLLALGGRRGVVAVVEFARSTSCLGAFIYPCKLVYSFLESVSKGVTCSCTNVGEGRVFSNHQLARYIEDDGDTKIFLLGPKSDIF